MKRDNDLTWQECETTKGTGRKKQVRCLRISEKMITKGLNPTQRDAARAIEQAYQDLEKGFGYALLGTRTTNLHGVGANSKNRYIPSDMPTDMIDRMRKRIGKLHEWEFICTKEKKAHWKDAAEAIHKHGLSARAYAKHIKRAPNTILNWYKNALDEYARLQGWMR